LFESELSCMCVMGINCASFYHFEIEFWNCSDRVA
jgi:hypothetical protein